MDFCFYLITDRKSSSGGMSVEEVVTRAVEGGVKGVLLREKDLPERELLALAGRVRDLTARSGVKLLISERSDIALAVGADGVQVSGRSLPAEKVRELIGNDKYMSVSTHSVEEALAAQSAGADFITLSPVYESPSKPGYGPALGLEGLETVCRSLTIPVFALGGMNPQNAASALKAGAYGIAVITSVFSAPDPTQAAGEMIDSIREFKLKRLI
jgi:thiamine-phosphate pyrophosphorylase